uniref:Uncharacterized protein n=1 Tax=Anguilla anguilla TaxID=7936 RepID=A0A0E9Q9Y7_ANGAN
MTGHLFCIMIHAGKCRISSSRPRTLPDDTCLCGLRSVGATESSIKAHVILSAL